MPSFYKNGEQEGKISPVWVLGIRRRREDVRKWGRMVKTVEILRPHICKWKNETCSNYSRNGGEG
jgi:hypothetical protein